MTVIGERDVDYASGYAAQRPGAGMDPPGR